jgi:hypothetical protein
VLGNACKNARLKRMRAWKLFVEAYHVLIARLIMSNAYAIFTNSLMEDRIYLEGLALWDGHNYSSMKGRDISQWADEYRRLIMKKSCSMRTYLQWSTSVHQVLHGERALRELAQIVVYSTKCMGRQKALYVPDAMERRIQRAGGLNGLIRCNEHAVGAARVHRFLGQSDRDQNEPVAQSKRSARRDSADADHPGV